MPAHEFDDLGSQKADRFQRLLHLEALGSRQTPALAPRPALNHWMPIMPAAGAAGVKNRGRGRERLERRVRHMRAVFVRIEIPGRE